MANISAESLALFRRADSGEGLRDLARTNGGGRDSTGRLADGDSTFAPGTSTAMAKANPKKAFLAESTSDLGGKGRDGTVC